MVAAGLLAAALTGFLNQTSTFATRPFDKIGFELDTTDRARQTSLIEETARSAHERNGTKVNIAVWNMHINENHHFEDILKTGLQPMGRGGGFRVVVFLGKGFLRNEGGLEVHNWRYSGNFVVNGNVVIFQAVDACMGAWGCMKSMYDGSYQQPL